MSKNFAVNLGTCADKTRQPVQSYKLAFWSEELIKSKAEKFSKITLLQTSWLHRASTILNPLLLPTDAHNVKHSIPSHSAQYTRLTGHNMQP